MNIFLTIAIVHLVALASPGPDFLFVSQTAISRSRRQAFFGVIGITLGITFWAALALLGLQLLLQRLAWLQQLIAVAGGLYLLWLGVQLLRSALTRSAGSRGTASVREGSDLATLRAGLLTNLANPKAVVYFASVFSAFVGGRLGGVARWGLWALVGAESLLWFSLVATVFAMPPMRRAYLRLARAIDAMAGAVFVAFGLRLLLARRGG